jgi:hypothetical protein
MSECRDCGAPFTPQSGNHVVCAACVARKSKEMSARLSEHSPLNALLFQVVADRAEAKARNDPLNGPS